MLRHLLLKKSFGLKLIFILVLAIIFFTSFSPTSAIARINILRDYYDKSEYADSTLILQFDFIPNYEIINYSEKNILSLKIKNTILPSSLALKKDFVNNIFIKAQVEKINTPGTDEIWLNLYLKDIPIEYTVDADYLQQGILLLKINKIIPERTLYPNAVDALRSHILTKYTDSEKLSFIVNKKPDFELKIDSLPNVVLNLTLKNTKLEFKPTPIDSEFIKSIKYKQTGKNLQIQLVMLNEKFKIDTQSIKNPYQLLLNIQKSELGFDVDLDSQTNFLNTDDSENDDEATRTKYNYTQAEIKFRELQYAEAYRLFNEVYQSASTREIGSLALIRAADSLHYQQQQKKEFDGYIKVIQAYEKALNLTEELGLTSYDPARILLLIGYNYQLANFYEEAEDYYDRIIKDYSKSYYLKETRYRKGELSLLIKDYPAAIRLFQDFLDKYPDASLTPEANYKLGVALFYDNNFKMAEERFLIGHRLNPKIPNTNAEILYAEAGTYYNQKAYGSFVAKSKNLMTGFPNNILSAVAAINLGDYYTTEAQTGEAIDSYNFAEQSKNKDISLVAKMKIANIFAENLETNDYKPALDQYEIIFNNALNNNIKEEALMRIVISHTLHEQGNLAIEAINRYQAVYPEGKYKKNGALNSLLIENITNIARQAYIDEKYSDVVSVYVNYRKLVNESENQFLLWILANSYSKLNNFQEANQFYQLLLRSNSPSRIGELQFEIGDNHMSSNRYDEALIYFTGVVEEYPNTVFGNYAYLRIAEIFLIHKEYQKSLEALEKLIKQNKGDIDPLFYDLVPRAWFEIAELQKELGFYEKAFEAYTEVKSTFRHALKNPATPVYVTLSMFFGADMSRILKANDQALALYKTAIENYPNSNQVPWAYYYSALIYLEQQRYPQALESFYKVLNFTGELPIYLRQIVENGKEEIERDQEYARYLLGDN